MNKIIKNALVNCLPLLASVPTLAQESESYLTHYCSLDDVNLQQSVQVGEIKSLNFNQGAFYVIESDSEYLPSLQNIEDALNQLGLSDNCKEFLLMGSKFESYDKGDIAARVYFEFDKSRLTKESTYILNTLRTQIKNASNPALILEGHTDNIGTNEYNFSLGFRRASSVQKYLVANGVKPSTLESVSKGETQPIANNDTSQGRKSNRRVDLIVD
ncbi:OmpA family protein [Vibrio maerlii]|uniref:OmpA family protein n=1 Tax=Vibrio maerlii TaxID=2231648 RepID=UPI000E3E87DF|nr:OmpA family protein [Vibrio maerlii]